MGISMTTRCLVHAVFIWMPIVFTPVAFTDYDIGPGAIFKDVLESSKEIKSLQNTLLAQEDLTESEKKYYYPKADLLIEYNDFYGEVDPAIEEDEELTLSITSQLYSDVALERISGAENNRLSALYSLEETKSGLYFSIIEQLINIEVSRQFLHESDTIREKMNKHIAQISNAVSVGVSPRSYLRETQLIKVRFDDVVSTVKSDIDNYFTRLSLTTGYVVEHKELIGLDHTFISLILAEDISFDAEQAMKKNLHLLSRYHEVESLKNSANSQFEKLKITAFNDTNVGLKSDADSSFGEIRETSSAGLRLEYKLFDFQRLKTRSSAHKIYLSEKGLLDSERERMLVQIQELSESYENNIKKRTNLLEQISLSKSLIETQEREMLIDRIEFIDMITSLSDLVQTYVALLNNDLQLYGTIVSYKTIIAERFNY